MSVATRIRNRRIELGITQTQLAKDAGLTPAAISQFEAGLRKPSFDASSKLAAALKISIDYLMGNSEANHAIINLDPELEAMLRGISEFSEENKKLLFEFYEFLKSRKKNQ